jgi:ABC-type phosphate transport system substrate-binding protein
MPSFASFYPEYPCSYNNPLSCDRPFQTAQELKGAKFCLECGFPATLSEQVKIKGNSGTYQVTSYLGVRGYGRLYSGVQIKNKQPIEIKEYILPNSCFNEQETLERKQIFQRVGGIQLADSKIQNFRLVNTREAITDEKGERCYLISQKIEASQTLSQYLKQNGKMTAYQIREILNQILQTLEFLHSQKIRFPSDQVKQGIAHGNINLDSVLIKPTSNQQFYIYLCDLAIWENLFIPPTITQPAPAQQERDLESLGLVAFYLLAGRTSDYASNQPLDPKDNQQWSTTDIHLKQFIEQLIGLGTPFSSAEVARQALMQLPKECQENSLSPLSEDEPVKPGFKKWSIWLLILPFILLAGGIFYYFCIRQPIPDNDKYLEWSKLQRNFSDVTSMPTGKFEYTGLNPGTWTFLEYYQIKQGITLVTLFTNPKPGAGTIFKYVHVALLNLENLEQGEKYFAITSLANNLSNKLQKTFIAYDGLMVYVKFDNQNNKFADMLDGQITLEQLRDIYTGRITNWQQIKDNLPNLKIIPYAPLEPEAISKFKELVLKNDPQGQELFENKVTRLDTATNQKKLTNGMISFGIISKIKGQCAGYPLAIVDGNKPAIQPLFQKDDHRPIKPSDDLCQHHRYFFDVNTFKVYPLGYPIFVVYPKSTSRSSAGSSFAEILTTREGQCLLGKVNLVPLQTIPVLDNINDYDCKSLP